MHIAFNGWFWDRPNTGSGQYIRSLVPALRHIAPDLQITLVLPPHNTTPDALPPEINLAPTRGPTGRLGKIWFEQRGFPKMVAQVGADVAHVPYWGPPLSSPARLVVSVLDVAPLILPQYSHGIGKRMYTALVSAASAGAAHTITLSESAKDDILTYLRLPEERVTVTYLGVDHHFHPRMGAENDEAVRAKYDLPEEFVLYMGGFDARKQVDQALLAYTFVLQAEGERLPLVVAGQEPNWGSPVFPDMRRYAQQLEIADYLVWPGYIEEADKPALYRLADVFVFPSVYEGFGLPVLEAMASGTPVVANRIDVFEEIVGDGAFLVSNAREMAGAIIALINQEPLRDSMINQGIAQATRYQWRKTAQNTLAIYESVMNR